MADDLNPKQSKQLARKGLLQGAAITVGALASVVVFPVALIVTHAYKLLPFQWTGYIHNVSLGRAGSGRTAAL